MRLGEVLIATEVITPTQLEAALRQQAVYGARLGTNLIELGYADFNQIARGLARQLGVPAAQNKHFQGADPAALKLLPPSIAARFAAVPIAFAETPEGRRLVVCLRAPTDERTIHTITEATGMPLMASVAAELAIFFWLEHHYGIERHQRYRQVQPGQSQPLPGTQSEQFDAVPDPDAASGPEPVSEEVPMPPEMQLVDLDAEGVQTDFSQYSLVGQQQDSLLDMAETTRVSVVDIDPTVGADADSAREARTDSPYPPTLAPRPSMTGDAGPRMTAPEAVAAIRRAESRDQATDAAVAFLRGSFGAGLLLIAREDVALGLCGFGGQFDAATVQSILLPLTSPSIFQAAYDGEEIFRGPPPEAGKSLQNRFFKLFQLQEPPAEVIVTPVLLRERVVMLIYAHAIGGGALQDRAVQELWAVAQEISEAFVRFIRANRGQPAGR